MNVLEGLGMKKMKKMIAVLASTLVALIPIFVLAMPAHAEVIGDRVFTWREQVGEDEYVDGGPIVVTVTGSDEDDSWYFLNGYYWDYDKIIANASEEELAENADEVALYRGKFEAECWGARLPYFEPGDVVTVQLPFSGTMVDYTLFESDDCWAIDFTSNSVILTCLEVTPWIEFGVTYSGGSAAPQNDFWFIPMKTQLAVAADIVATNGGTAVAEASGDFGLSYEIMKYLDDHPGVTLKYTLTYKGEEHLIVIPGGGKFANPEIPWYGPEYLIGNFGK